jgi:hypothetical protein
MSSRSSGRQQPTPAEDPLWSELEPGEESDFEPIIGWDLVKDNVEN